MAIVSRDHLIESILNRVKAVSADIEKMTAERRVLSNNFTKLTMIPDRTAKLEAFSALSLESDEIDLRHAVYLQELRAIVDSIDELQRTYGADPMLTEVRDFYVDKIL